VAKIDVYTPRKVTPQNEANLPSTHDQSKRTSYMQIQLEEPEIAEAIRNYLRQQIPVVDGDEMPVVLTAGRGDNGHTATVTILPSTPVVTGAERPTDAFDTFDAANADAAARNAAAEASQTPPETHTENNVAEVETPEEQADTEPEATPTTEIVQDDPTTERIETTVAPQTKETPWKEESNPDEAADPVNNAPDQPKSIFEDVTDERDETPQSAPVTRKASNLFGLNSEEPETSDYQPSQATEPKSKSIFDNL